MIFDEDFCDEAMKRIKDSRTASFVIFAFRRALRLPIDEEWIKYVLQLEPESTLEMLLFNYINESHESEFGGNIAKSNDIESGP